MTAGFFACKKIKVNKKLMNKSNLFLAILDYFISSFCCHFDRRSKMNEEGKSNYYAIIPEEEPLYKTGWNIKSLKAGKWCRVHHINT